MECSVELLNLASAKEPIPDWSSEQPTIDPHQTIQVHDYLQVSFFRTPAEVKVASKRTIELFQKYYPELLEKKFFVNVPFLMGWVYNAMKLLVAKETFRKLIMISYGEELAKHMGSESIPTDYGGTGKPLGSAMIPSVDAEAGCKDDKEGVLEAAPTKTDGGSEEHPSVLAVPGANGGETTTVGDANTTPGVAPAVPAHVDVTYVAPVAPIAPSTEPK